MIIKHKPVDLQQKQNFRIIFYHSNKVVCVCVKQIWFRSIKTLDTSALKYCLNKVT